MRGTVTRSDSTWRQPLPLESPHSRARLVAKLADQVAAVGPRRVRIGIDGRTASGKTTFGDELARDIAKLGRDVFRASLDDFKRPWSERHLYDRTSGEGYYRNAFDIDATRRLLLEPAAPSASGVVALCSIDPLTQINHQFYLAEVDPIAVADVVIDNNEFEEPRQVRP